MTWQQHRPELTECDREAIHHIAYVQPFGGLIAVNADWVIVHRSANCGELLQLSELPAIGSALADWISPRAIDRLRDALMKTTGEDEVERVFGLKLTRDSDLLDCAIHSANGKIIIEFERHDEDGYASHVAMIGPMMAELDPIRDLDELCNSAAKLVRRSLGYDRVMVYKFHPDDSGEVIAEDRREDLEPFLGLRYPRADIPQQARELFVRNRFRVIRDIKDDLVPIEPTMGIDGGPLDMSMSVLRASSSIHLEYLANMGVKATLTIAIIRQKRLWGLISCHHYSPKLPAYSLRTVAEMFSQMFSLMLDRILIETSETLRDQARGLHDRLMQRLAGGVSLSDSLPLLDEILDNVVEHDGASILIGGEYKTRGLAPTESQFMAMAPSLGTAPVSTVIATPSLKDHVPEAAEFSDRITGALIIPISRSPRDYLVLWRKPLTKTVTWAGNPEKAIAPAGDRLQPRESFAAWQQDVRGRSDEWSEAEIQIAEGLRVTLLEVILRMTDEVARERSRAQEQQDLLIAELNHRVRNILNLIRSLVAQSQHEAIDVSAFASIIGGRITALASAHDNITRENWSPAPLEKLIETELAAYLDEKKERFALTGEKVLVTPEAYTVLALVVHEMVTNSAKYGSLCDRSGSLSVHVSRNPFGDLQIAWRESGGPPVKPPTRRGFGSTIIERSIPFELKGETDVRFKLSGLEADFLVPARYIAMPENAPVSEANPQSETQDTGAQNAATSGTSGIPDHVLVVEDSMIIALDTEENLRQLGIGSIDVASSVAGALGAIEKRLPDLAIVDFNLGTESSLPVTQELKKRGARFVLATGYAELGQKSDEIGAMTVLRKPYGRSEIEELLEGLSSGAFDEASATSSGSEAKPAHP
ncbi:MAG: HWE histidine kinase domain-containing protein [Pseudomonadota bacterium]|nr:HWE histidine kinase domain-containing protein [Pseudomonadota bacterium]